MRWNGSAGLAFVLGLCAAAMAGAAAVQADPVEKGLVLITKHCARCHAIGATGDSTHKEAPPFRSVVTRYPLENLAEALAEGILSGHPDMPEFVFQPDEIDAILAYLDKLKDETGGGDGNPGGVKQ